MLAIRRSRLVGPRSVSTLHAASSTVPVPEYDGSIKKRRTLPLKTRRPQISLEHLREWKRPLAYGVLPAFDEALKFIKADSEMLKQDIQNLQASLAAATRASEREQLQEKINYLGIQCKINLPEVQWKCANGMGT